MTYSDRLEGYVDVAGRLRLALDKYPELRVVESRPAIVTTPDGAVFVEVTVTVYRTPDDTLPAIATAWEPFPGRTPYTKNSEMMNCSTSALGRALGFMGFGIRASLASLNEVDHRRGENHPSVAEYVEPDQAPVVGIDRGPTAAQLTLIGRLAARQGIEAPAFSTRREASDWIKEHDRR